MTILRKIRWISTGRITGDYGVQATYKLLNGWLTIDRHFPGVRFWSVEVRAFGCYFINLKPLKLSSAGKGGFQWKLRLGALIIGWSEPRANEFPFVEVLRDETLTLSGYLPSTGSAGI